jgi:6-phosphogluconate dehydrogenase
MGANMADRIATAGHQVIGYDKAVGQRGSDPASQQRGRHRDVATLAELVAALERPRTVWVMVPAGDPTRETIASLADLLDDDDLVVDGGNSRYTEDIRHGEELAAKGIGFVDCGVSGGIWGITEGYALMCGGADEHVDQVRPIFEALKPPGEYGFAHAGPIGAGHFAKMVHNGIEYGLMQAYAEGYELLAATDVVTDVPAVIKSWRSGTVIRSWLLDLLDRALDTDADLSELRGYAADSGEGRWTIQAGVDHAVPLPVITAALFARFASRQDDSPAMKVVAALRNQFGGHPVTSAAGSEQVDADVPTGR